MPSSHRPTRGKRQLADVLGTRLTRVALAVAAAAALFVQTPVTRVAAGQSNCTVEQGQALIDTGKYDKAIQAFTCVISAGPTEVEGYRGRIEAEVLLARYSDAVRDYQRVMAYVVPVHSDAEATIMAGYAARLDVAPTDVRALTGASFARWWFFHYPQAIQLTDQLLAIRPNDAFGTLFRGSARLLHGVAKAKGVEDLDRAIQLDPTNPNVRFIVADAYTYGLPDPERAFAEASLALDWGLDTPRIHAILATCYQAFGDLASAATHIYRSISLVTSELVPTAPLAAGASISLDLVPGRVYAIPIAATKGETISISTSSRDFWDSIAVLLAPDGTPVIGSDDANGYMAAFDWVAEETTTYTLQGHLVRGGQHWNADGRPLAAERSATAKYVSGGGSFGFAALDVAPVGEERRRDLSGDPRQERRGWVRPASPPRDGRRRRAHRPRRAPGSGRPTTRTPSA